MILSITLNLLIVYKACTLALASAITFLGILLVLGGEDQKDMALCILGFVIVFLGIGLGYLIFI